MLPMSDGDAGVQAYIASMEPRQAAIAKRLDGFSSGSMEGKAAAADIAPARIGANS